MLLIFYMWFSLFVNINNSEVKNLCVCFRFLISTDKSHFTNALFICFVLPLLAKKFPSFLALLSLLFQC